MGMTPKKGTFVETEKEAFELLPPHRRALKPTTELPFADSLGAGIFDPGRRNI